MVVGVDSDMKCESFWDFGALFLDRLQPQPFVANKNAAL
jgi:hypothetical protein